MGKRGAAKSAAAPKAKAQKLAEEVAEIPAVSELVALAEGMPESCREMLVAMAPHSLKRAEGERHEYQEKMNDVLAALFAGLAEERRAAVAAAESQVAEAEQEKEAAAASAEAAKEKEAAETAARDAKAQASAEAEEAAEAAKAALAAAHEKVASFDEEQKAVAGEKELHVTLAGEKMAQLKTGGFPGRLWRERDRVIGEIFKALEALDPDEAALRLAFAAAMKVKPDARGAFAEKTIGFAEGLLAKHIAELTEKLASGETEKAHRAGAVVAAEAALKAAEHNRDQSQEAYIAADNTLLEATEAKNALLATLKDFAPKMKGLEAALATAKEGLSGVQALIAKFEELRNPPAPAAEEEKAAEEPAAEAPMAVEQPAA